MPTTTDIEDALLERLRQTLDRLEADQEEIFAALEVIEHRMGLTPRKGDHLKLVREESDD